MTATQSWNLGTGVCVQLECDDCGFVFADARTHLVDWQTLWQAAHRAGWRGLPRPSGPHRCAECAALLRRAAGSSPTRTAAVRAVIPSPHPAVPHPAVPHPAVPHPAVPHPAATGESVTGLVPPVSLTPSATLAAARGAGSTGLGGAAAATLASPEQEHGEAGQPVLDDLVADDAGPPGTGVPRSRPGASEQRQSWRDPPKIVTGMDNRRGSP